MKKMTANEEEAYLEELALSIKRLLERKECVRKADSVEPLYMTKEEVCEYKDISFSMFKAAIDKAGRLGIPICYDYMTGYYVGNPGEQSKMGMAKLRSAVGLMEAARQDFVNVVQSNSLEDARQYLLLGGFDSASVFKAFRGVKKALPVQVEKALEDVKQLPGE